MSLSIWSLYRLRHHLPQRPNYLSFIIVRNLWLRRRLVYLLLLISFFLCLKLPWCSSSLSPWSYISIMYTIPPLSSICLSKPSSLYKWYSTFLFISSTYFWFTYHPFWECCATEWTDFFLDVCKSSFSELFYSLLDSKSNFFSNT